LGSTSIFKGDDGKLIRTTKKFPKDKWRYKEMPELCIIKDKELWEATQKRLDEAAGAWNKSRDGSTSKRRDEVYPRRLVTPECGICGHVMYQSGSGKWANYFCPNGVGHKDGCTFRGHKSITQIETAVLQPVLTEVLTEATGDDFVAMANAHLKELAKLPKEDISPLLQELDEVKGGLKNLYDLVEKGGCFNGAEGRITALERRKAELAQEIEAVKSRSGPIPPPLTKEATRIARDLGVGEQTVRRAYDFGMRQAGLNPLGADGKLQRGECRKIAIEQIRAVHRHLDAGKLSVKQIAQKTGVSQSTIRRELEKRRAA
jgi:hypothetical protein